ncbi:nitric oxide synthase oxygenase [Paenibacillus sp. GCM10027627]|uniref:nitric oxide synthase oxygenase n=1 Tax=unclassified Paenibacillus TaxID=185978 RepID=UPI00363B2AB5
MNTVDKPLLLEEAANFIQLAYTELGKTDYDIQMRLLDIEAEIAATATYTHTAEELQHGAKLAWRNSNRCIGRLFWESLSVLDARHVHTTTAMAEALFEHIKLATNDGKIRPVMTIFPQADSKDDFTGPCIWNHQLVRYAGYNTADGGVVGDPHSVSFTDFCQKLGWQGGGTPFDVLPLVISIKDGHPEWFPIPPELILEVPISHPDIPGIRDLGLQWYAVPFVSDMRLEIGGVHYSAAPFNGWYMGTEIGARNLADEQRYNMLPQIARLMELDTSKASSLWKDRALVELNIAVLHSFKERGVTIVDHHTAAQQFMRFEKNEEAEGRNATGRWSWLVPPLSPATTPIYHKSYSDTIASPNFFYRVEKRP